MNEQKSIYRMSDRGLREYKRQQKRRKQIHRRICTMIATICMIIVCAVSYHGIRSVAAGNGDNQLKFKYYTQVTVAYGESLWDLSDDYIDYEEYKNKNEYIAEVQSINHLSEDGSVRAGQTLIVPYFSYDFVK